MLNVSGNEITSLKDIKYLGELEVLDARNNAIDDIDDLTESISALVSLKELSLQDNPVTQHYRYKENLIANNDTISTYVRNQKLHLHLNFIMLIRRHPQWENGDRYMSMLYETI